MWIVNRFAGRALIWITAAAITAQSLPAASCGCAGRRSGCQSAVRPEYCCSTEAKGSSCCSQRTGSPCACTGAAVCHCGDDRDGRTSSCCFERARPISCCCAEKDGDGQCQCGPFCPCNVSEAPKSLPAEPSTPERSSFQRLVASPAVDKASTDVVVLPSVRPTAESRWHPLAASSLDRCITLSRFTL